MLEWFLIIGMFLVSVAGTAILFKYAPRLGLLHMSNERSSHESLVPHGGGLGFVAAVLLSLSILLFQGADFSHKCATLKKVGQ